MPLIIVALTAAVVGAVLIGSIIFDIEPQRRHPSDASPASSIASFEHEAP